MTPVIERFDFDSSGDLGVLDIDGMAVQIANGVFDPIFDLDYDEVVNQKDADIWMRDTAIVSGFAESYLAADANLDGTVDAADLNSLALSWRNSDARWSGGDFNFDGVTDAADLNSLALNWQASIPIADAAVALPEPSGKAVALIAILAFLQCRRSSRGCGTLRKE